MTSAVRRRAATALVCLASVAIVLAVVVGYVRRAAVDPDQFANRATAALRDESVRTVIAERVTDDLVLRRRADLIAARPLIESVTADVIGTRAFTSLFRAAVRDVHRALFARSQDTVTLTVADVGTVVAAALEQLRPKLAQNVRASGRVELFTRHLGSLSATLARAADRVRLLAWLLLAAAVLLSAAAIGLAADRRRAVVGLGIGAAAGGILVVVALAIGRSIAVHSVSGADQRAAADAIWGAFLDDLRRAGWFLAGSGAVVAAAADSLLRPVALGAPLRRAWEVAVSEPQRRAWKVVRGVALVAAGIVVVAAPGTVVSVAVVVAGVYLIYEGVAAVLRVIAVPEVERPVRRLRLPSARRVAAVALPVGLIAAAISVFVATGGTTTPAPAAGGCDGAAALCGRRLDAVALAATHNSMSVPLPGWYSAMQERPIPDQLRAGIRGLLIDTHYGDRLSNGRVRTVFGSNNDLHRVLSEDGVSPAAVNAALRIRDRVGFSGKGQRGIYLCHTFCELGATPLSEVLTQIHDFMVSHPDEVLVIINQDEITPQDFVAAVRDAGLERLAYRGPVTAGDWMTLRQMIDSDQRIVFLAEHDAGAAPWYRPAYVKITEETPYGFTKTAQLTDPKKLAASCRPNRGPQDAPLFLINHWITTDPLPRPSLAAKVNAYTPLLRRARECQRLRRHMPNLVAVDFYEKGDVFGVVDTLNGLRR